MASSSAPAVSRGPTEGPPPRRSPPRRGGPSGSGQEFSLRFAYSQQGLIGRLLEQHDGRTLREDFGDRVEWVVWLPRAEAEGFAQAVIEATAGTVVPESL